MAADSTFIHLRHSRTWGALVGFSLSLVVLLAMATSAFAASATSVAHTPGAVRGLPSVNFSSVACANATTAWVVGSGGCILTTTTGGTKWVKRASHTGKNLRSVDCATTKVVWAVGDNGVILNTVNGGVTWVKQRSGTWRNLTCVTCLNAKTAWAVGTGGLILKTTNGGRSWAKQSSGTRQTIRSLACADAKIAWALAYDYKNVFDAPGVVLTTTTGGSKWVKQSGGWGPFASVVCASRKVAWIISGAWDDPGGDSIYKTTNGGKAWVYTANFDIGEPYDSDFVAVYLSSLAYAWPNTLWATGGRGEIYKSTNGGESWIPQESKASKLSSLACADSTVAWAVGAGGLIIKTTNGGGTWVKQLY